MTRALQCVILGCSDKDKPLLASYCESISHEEYDPEKILEPFATTPDVIFCLPSTSIADVEVAQSLRMNYPSHPIFFVTFKKEGFNKKLLLKNGFTDVFYLPWEEREFSSALKVVEDQKLIPGLKDYVPINVLDLKGQTSPGFETKVHLRINNKFVHFSYENEELSEKKLEKLIESNIDTLFIHKNDEEKFHKYNTHHFRAFGGMSDTEKTKRLNSLLRELVAELLIDDNNENTFEKSRDLMARVKEIVATIVAEDKRPISKKLESLMKKETSYYMHAGNVATYSGLFAVKLGLPEVENIAIAGLLHDLGKLDNGQNDEEMSSDEIYKLHPQRSIDLLKKNKIALPDSSIRAIQQHHEWANGKGFPKGHGLQRISNEARVLAIANVYDHVMTSSEAITTPLQALESMLEENLNPDKTQLDTQMLEKLIDIVKKST